MRILKEYIFEGRVSKEDKNSSDYKYVLFKVPKKAGILQISYNYSKGDNVLDIGVFDSKGSFRGWSGSNKSELFISENAATPGYLHGKIYPGSWKIILGLYKISQEGCRYTIKVRIGGINGELQKRKIIRPFKQEYAETPKKRWFKGDLHVHTNHSDGAKSIRDLVNEAMTIGLNFVALTDHNTISQNLHVEEYESSDFLLIPAEEVTTYYGHANVWGNRKWIDFRRRSMEDFQELIDEVHSQGLLFSINHPEEMNFPDGYWRFREVSRFDCIEVWHGPWSIYDYRSLIWWDSLLQKGKKIVAVGGSDFHGTDLPRLGNPTTWVYSDMLSVNNILNAIRRGHVFISRYVNGPQIYLYADADGDGRVDSICGDEVHLSRGDKLTIYAEVKKAKDLEFKLISRGEAVKIEKVNSSYYRVAYRTQVENDGYFRAEVIRHNSQESDNAEISEVLALTNPIYVRVKKQKNERNIDSF